MKKLWIKFRIWRKTRRPWITYLPYWLQHDSDSIFVSVFLTLVGASSLLGISEPSSITSKMEPWMFNLWGAALVVAGGTATSAIILRDALLKRLASNITGILMLVFAGWATAAVGFPRAGVSVLLALVLGGLSFVKSAQQSVELAALRYMKDFYEGDSDGTDSR